MRGNSVRGNRETPRLPPPMLAEDGPRRLTLSRGKVGLDTHFSSCWFCLHPAAA
jgi:hypothetical protein